ncbi:hypothetical protein ACVITL_006569 [Rhizobium pisi]
MILTAIRRTSRFAAAGSGPAQILPRVYVRRSDLDGHIHRLESNIKDLREEHREMSKETTRRLDAIIASLAKNNA